MTLFLEFVFLQVDFPFEFVVVSGCTHGDAGSSQTASV